MFNISTWSPKIIHNCLLSGIFHQKFRVVNFLIFSIFILISNFENVFYVFNFFYFSSFPHIFKNFLMFFSFFTQLFFFISFLNQKRYIKNVTFSQNTPLSPVGNYQKLRYKSIEIQKRNQNLSKIKRKCWKILELHKVKVKKCKKLIKNNQRFLKDVWKLTEKLKKKSLKNIEIWAKIRRK